MNITFSYKSVLTLLLMAILVVGILPSSTYAGSNGQQLVVKVCGAQSIGIQGHNQNGQMVGASFPLNNGCVQQKISGWWWKGVVEVTAYYPGGQSKTVDVNVPINQASNDWFYVLVGSYTSNSGPNGYTYCADEGQRCNFSGTKDVAYGANGRFSTSNGKTNGIDCNNNIFGDPTPGVHKACYIKDSTLPQPGHKILARAKQWVDQGIPYNQEDSKDGYRTDCSGFVSYAWELGSSPTTVTLKNFATQIGLDELQPGDAVNNQQPGNSGHVVLFVQWIEQSKGTFLAYEENGGYGEAVKTTLTLVNSSNQMGYIKEYESLSQTWIAQRKK